MGNSSKTPSTAASTADSEAGTTSKIHSTATLSHLAPTRLIQHFGCSPILSPATDDTSSAGDSPATDDTSSAGDSPATDDTSSAGDSPATDDTSSAGDTRSAPNNNITHQARTPDRSPATDDTSSAGNPRGAFIRRLKATPHKYSGDTTIKQRKVKPLRRLTHEQQLQNMHSTNRVWRSVAPATLLAITMLLLACYHQNFSDAARLSTGHRWVIGTLCVALAISGRHVHVELHRAGITTLPPSPAEACYSGVQAIYGHPYISAAIAGYLSTAVFYVSGADTLMGWVVIMCGDRAVQRVRHSDVYQNTLAKRGRCLAATKRPLLGCLALTTFFQTCTAHSVSNNGVSNSYELSKDVPEATSWIPQMGRFTRGAIWGACALATTLTIGIWSAIILCRRRCPLCLRDCPGVTWTGASAYVQHFRARARERFNSNHFGVRARVRIAALTQRLAGLSRWAASYTRHRAIQAPAESAESTTHLMTAPPVQVVSVEILSSTERGAEDNCIVQQHATGTVRHTPQRPNLQVPKRRTRVKLPVPEHESGKPYLRPNFVNGLCHKS